MLKKKYLGKWESFIRKNQLSKSKFHQSRLIILSLLIIKKLNWLKLDTTAFAKIRTKWIQLSIHKGTMKNIHYWEIHFVNDKSRQTIYYWMCRSLMIWLNTSDQEIVAWPILHCFQLWRIINNTDIISNQLKHHIYLQWKLIFSKGIMDLNQKTISIILKWWDTPEKLNKLIKDSLFKIVEIIHQYV